MTDYKALYFMLFAAVADALDDLEQSEIEKAKQRLIRAEQEAEDKYLEEED